MRKKKSNRNEILKNCDWKFSTVLMLSVVFFIDLMFVLSAPLKHQPMGDTFRVQANWSNCNKEICYCWVREIV